MAFCQDPLAAHLQETFMDAVYQMFDIFRKSSVGLPVAVRNRIDMAIMYFGDFASFCPMFHHRTRECRSCGNEFLAMPESDDFLCDACVMNEVFWSKHDD